MNRSVLLILYAKKVRGKREKHVWGRSARRARRFKFPEFAANFRPFERESSPTWLSEFACEHVLFRPARTEPAREKRPLLLRRLVCASSPHEYLAWSDLLSAVSLPTQHGPGFFEDDGQTRGTSRRRRRRRSVSSLLFAKRSRFTCNARWLV